MASCGWCMDGNHFGTATSAPCLAERKPEHQCDCKDRGHKARKKPVAAKRRKRAPKPTGPVLNKDGTPRKKLGRPKGSKNRVTK